MANLTPKEDRAQREFDKLYETYEAGVELAPAQFPISYYWANKMARAIAKADMVGVSRSGFYFSKSDIPGTELAFGVSIIEDGGKYYLDYDYDDAINNVLEYWLNQF
jgi:hypothetical protein